MSAREPALLVVDDNEANRYTLTRRLRRDGYSEIAEAENGLQALELLKERPFDLVLLDITMPEMDGYDVLKEIKSDMDLRDIPVIMISAEDKLDSVVRCIELGAEDYLPKPFNAVLLKARVSASIEKKRLKDQEMVYHQHIEDERRRADNLLHALLPMAAVHELKSQNTVAPRRFDNITVSPASTCQPVRGIVRRVRIGEDKDSWRCLYDNSRHVPTKQQSGTCHCALRLADGDERAGT
jgi:adenylate cyclase